MDPIQKSYAAFLKNTIEPMLDKLHDVIGMAESRGIMVTRENISEVMEKFAILHFTTFTIEWVFRLLIAGMICFTVYKVM